MIKLISKNLLYSEMVGVFISEWLVEIQDYLSQIVVSNESYKKIIDENISIEYIVDSQNGKITVAVEDKSMNREYFSASIDRNGNRLRVLSKVKKDDSGQFSFEDVYQYYDKDVQIGNDIVCKKGFSSHLIVSEEKGKLEAMRFRLYDKKGNKIFSKSTSYDIDEMNNEYQKHGL